MARQRWVELDEPQRVAPLDVLDVLTFRTIPGCNVLAMPPGIEMIHEVFVRLPNLVDIQLQSVSASADTVGLFTQSGRPAWFQAVRLSEYLTVNIWPIPDDAYELCIFARSQVAFHPVPQTPQVTMDREQKAEDLLCAWLTTAQRACLEKNGFFIVKGSATGALYRISKGVVFNVVLLHSATGLPAQKLCFAPVNIAYSGDIMLAQKIMLETDELQAKRIANKQPAHA